VSLPGAEIVKRALAGAKLARNGEEPFSLPDASDDPFAVLATTSLIGFISIRDHNNEMHASITPLVPALW
jgi:hypothetical protein